jgi:hypothetical protein
VVDLIRGARKRKLPLPLPLCSGAPRGSAALHAAVHTLVSCSVNTTASGEVCYAVGSDASMVVEDRMGTGGTQPSAAGVDGAPAIVRPPAALSATLSDLAVVRMCDMELRSVVWG